MAKFSIEDLLNSLKGEITSGKENSLSNKEIWNMIANRESYEKMGFSSQSELSNWISDNPYDNLG